MLPSTNRVRRASSFVAVFLAIVAIASAGATVVPALAAHAAPATASDQVPVAPALPPGFWVSYSCLGGYIDLNGSSVCNDNTTGLLPFGGGGTTVNSMTGGCNSGPCNNPSSGPWGWSSSVVCIAYPNCEHYWTLPNTVSPVNMSSYCTVGQRCTGSISMWAQKPTLYDVNFTESTLPARTQWGVNFFGSDSTTTSSTITVPTPNGSYPFAVLYLDGYTASPASSSVLVSGAAVQQTINFTGVGSVVKSVSTTASPFDVAYDSGDGYILATANSPAEIVTLYASNDSVKSTKSIGTSYTLHGIVYDSTNARFYVAANTTTNNYYVLVYYAVNSTQIASVSVHTTPTSLVYDSAKKDILVSEPGYGMGVIATSTDRVTKTISLSTLETGSAYDSTHGYTFASESSGKVAVIQDSNLGLKQTITLSGCTSPAGVAYNNSSGDAYVACSGSSNLVVISVASLTQATSIALGQSSPTELVDAAGCIWVTDDKSSGEVSVVAESTGTADTVVNTIAVGSDPVGVVFDSATDQLFVANSGGSTISVLTTA